ncbi:MAG: hypothetical protein AAF748_05415 [Pseudomonadota bacterium]
MKKLLFSALSACFLATSASAWHWNPNHPVIPLEVAVACAAGAGVYEPFRLSYPRVAGLRTIVVHEGPTVTSEQADQISLCIEYYGGMNATGQRTELVRVNGPFGTQVVRRVRRERCTSVFSGGAGYCIKQPWY